MKKPNEEIEVIEPQKVAMKVEKGDRTIEFSPELSQQMCIEIIDLGLQVISGAERVTVEYFKNQVDSYCKELDTYIKEKTIDSDERKQILKDIEKIIDRYIDEINQTSNFEKDKYFIDKLSNIYIENLRESKKTPMPKKTDWFAGVKNLFSRH